MNEPGVFDPDDGVLAPALPARVENRTVDAWIASQFG
jgi:hypothetical protein